MSTYSQGVCGDGAAILEDGQMMSVDSIVQHLNAYERLVASRTEKLAAAESQLAALRARIAALEGERDDDQLLNKYAVCLNGAVTQHIYSRVNSDAQSVYERLVGLHHYNPDISVHFVAYGVEPNE